MSGMRRALVIATALALLAACGSSSPTATSLPGLTSAKQAKIRTDALSTAKGDQDAHPSSVMVFASRRHEANIAAGAGTGVFGEQPVYLVVIRGNFVASFGRGSPERASVVTLVLDRKTLAHLDYGFGGPVDTSKVGPGLPLHLG